MTDPAIDADGTLAPMPRPRGKRNGIGPREAEAAFARNPIEPTDADLADWQRGTAALARMPDRLVLQLTDGIPEKRADALRNVLRAEGRLDLLRYWPPDGGDLDIGVRAGARIVSTIPGDRPPPLWLGRLDPQGHTILYGTGGSGKGVLVAEWIRQLTDEGGRILVIDYENHPEEWSRRLSGLGAGRLERVLHVAPYSAGWKLAQGAIWKQASDLADLAAAWGATYVVIDSVVPACGATDPTKPEAAGQYAAALERIGLPALSLAHVTKAEDPAYPFGSVFWHNLARVTWSLQADGQVAVLVNRKANNYQRGGRYVIEVTWLDGLPMEVAERPYSAAIADRVAEVLAEQGPRTIEQLVADLDAERGEDQKPVAKNSVLVALRRGLKGDDRRFDIDAGRYSLRTPTQPDEV